MCHSHEMCHSDDKHGCHAFKSQRTKKIACREVSCVSNIRKNQNNPRTSASRSRPPGGPFRPVLVGAVAAGAFPRLMPAIPAPPRDAGMRNHWTCPPGRMAGRGSGKGGVLCRRTRLTGLGGFPWETTDRRGSTGRSAAAVPRGSSVLLHCPDRGQPFPESGLAAPGTAAFSKPSATSRKRRAASLTDLCEQRVALGG